MKNISIIGASAGLGLETARWALRQGHRVTTLSRSKPELPDQPGLRVVLGSATDAAVLSTAIEGAEVVIVTLGTGTKLNWHAISKGTTLYSDFAKVLVTVMGEKKYEMPVIVVTGFGAGESRAYVPFPLRLFMRTLLKKLYVDKTLMEEIISTGYGRWSIVRPGVLNDNPATGRYRSYDSFREKIEAVSISRADVARFLVQEAENGIVPGTYITLMGEG